MDLNIAWWNTSLSPPTTKKSVKLNKKGREAFFTVVRHLLVEGEVNLLGLCEVDKADIDELSGYLVQEGFSDWVVISLYSSLKNRVNDYCLLVDRSCLEYIDHAYVEHWDEARTYYKAGVRVTLRGEGDERVYVYLSHWQSQRNMNAKAHRAQLATVLRNSINAVFDEQGDDAGIVLMGDYNDDPFEDSLTHHLKSTRDKFFALANPRVLYNPFWRTLGAIVPHRHDDEVTWNYPSGTCYYAQNKELTFWKTFDQILFSSSFFGRKGWHLVEGNTKVYSQLELGAHFLNWHEVSDHLPVFASLTRV